MNYMSKTFVRMKNPCTVKNFRKQRPTGALTSYSNFSFALKLFLLTLLLCFPLPCLEGADWPLYRGDTQATGTVSTGKSSTGSETLLLDWEVRLEKSDFQASPIVVNETIFLGDSVQGLAAYQLKDGKRLWLFPLEYGVMAPAAYHKLTAPQSPDETEFLFFADSDGIMYALDAKTGKERWRFATEDVIDNSPNIDREKDRLLFGSQKGTLYCLECATGKVVWTFSMGDQIRCFSSIFERRCFVAGCDSKFHVIDLDTGKEISAVELEAPTGSTPALSGDCAYFGNEGNEFLCVNWKESKIVWKHPSKQAFRAPAACSENLVICGGFDRCVYGLDKKTGKAVWTFRTKSRIEGGPVIVKNRIFVCGSDSFLYELDLETGKEVASLEMPGRMIASPAIVGDRLIIGTDEGALCCVKIAP